MSDTWWLTVHVVAFVVSGGVFTLIAYFTMVGIVEDKSPWELWRDMRSTGEKVSDAAHAKRSEMGMRRDGEMGFVHLLMTSTQISDAHEQIRRGARVQDAMNHAISAVTCECSFCAEFASGMRR